MRHEGVKYRSIWHTILAFKEFWMQVEMKIIILDNKYHENKHCSSEGSEIWVLELLLNVSRF